MVGCTDWLLGRAWFGVRELDEVEVIDLGFVFWVGWLTWRGSACERGPVGQHAQTAVAPCFVPLAASSRLPPIVCSTSQHCPAPTHPPAPKSHADGCTAPTIAVLYEDTKEQRHVKTYEVSVRDKVRRQHTPCSAGSASVAALASLLLPDFPRTVAPASVPQCRFVAARAALSPLLYRVCSFPKQLEQIDALTMQATQD